MIKNKNNETNKINLSKISSWQLFLLIAASYAMLTMVPFIAGLIDTTFWKSHTVESQTKLGLTTILGLGAIQPILLAFRLLLITLLTQTILILFEKQIRFSILFRASLLASVSQTIQLILVLVCIFQYRDLQHLTNAPFSISATFPILAEDKLWGGAIRQLNATEILWLAIYYQQIRKYVTNKLALFVVTKVWLVGFFTIWILSLLPMLKNNSL